MMDLLVNVDYAEALLDRMLAWSLALVAASPGRGSISWVSSATSPCSRG